MKALDSWVRWQLANGTNRIRIPSGSHTWDSPVRLSLSGMSAVVIDARGAEVQCYDTAFRVIGESRPADDGGPWQDTIEILGGVWKGPGRKQDCVWFEGRDTSAIVLAPRELRSWAGGFAFVNEHAWCENIRIENCGIHNCGYAISHSLDPAVELSAPTTGMYSVARMRVDNIHVADVDAIGRFAGRVYDAWFTRIGGNIRPTELMNELFLFERVGRRVRIDAKIEGRDPGIGIRPMVRARSADWIDLTGSGWALSGVDAPLFDFLRDKH